ncbi:MAG: substrate-binding periplasmic protein [Aeromonadaceae bacterium]
MLLRTLWLITLLTALPALASCPHTLRVGWDDWPPYHYQDSQGQMQGFAVEVLTQITQELGCKLEFRERPWKRQLQELQQGDTDIAMEAYYNEERAQYANYSESYSPSMANLWTQPNQPLPGATITQLLHNGFLLGVTKEFYYGPEVENLLGHHNIQAVLSEEQNYAKLKKGRIQGFLGDWLATTWAIKQRGLQGQIIRSSLPIYSAPAFFMLSKKRLSSRFVTEFNHVLQQMKKDGRYQAILDKYTHLE